MKDNEYYMKLALKEARKAYKHNEVPVGAIIVSNDKIIAKGNNQRENSGDVTKHAELIAIRKASKKKKDWRLNDCTMYVTLFPCCECAKAILQTGITKVYYLEDKHPNDDIYVAAKRMFEASKIEVIKMEDNDE